MATDQESGTLEQQLESMLEVETFDPPADFVEHATITDAGIYEEAESDWKGFWEKQADALDWSERWDTVLDDSDPPFYKWFTGGKLNVSHNCVENENKRRMKKKAQKGNVKEKSKNSSRLLTRQVHSSWVKTLAS